MLNHAFTATRALAGIVGAARELFQRLLEATDPIDALTREPDTEVRKIADELWTRHNAAETEGFLEEASRATLQRPSVYSTAADAFEFGSSG